ncbi:hypothetical protein J6590_083615 [Homalodisca vitripennis]|nr:hypothetical protein J6590_083615 [Homalodisca vitripennis]
MNDDLITFILVQRLKSVVFKDLAPGIFSHSENALETGVFGKVFIQVSNNPITYPLNPVDLRRAFKSALPQTDDPYLNSPGRSTHPVEVFCTR